MTERDALELAYARAAGFCECIGGGCRAITHQPGVNRCTAPLALIDSATFFVIAPFADRSDPENVLALCSACAESPRRRGRRIVRAAGPADGTEA